MRKNFTRLISSVTRTKSFVIALTSLMILAGSVYLYAAIVAITPQSVNVSADLAVGGPSAGFTELSPIVIQEGNQKDFVNGSSGSFVLRAPEGWVFRQSGVDPQITAAGQVPNVSSGTVIYTSNTITIPITVSGENRVDRIAINGVALQAIAGSILPARAVTMSITGFSLSGFNSPINIANISQTYGSVRKLAFGTQPTATDIYAAIAPMTVLIQDWAGNTVTNATNSVSLAIGSNPGGGVLTTGESSRANGVVTFTDYKIDASGSNYTLVASSQGLGTATSSAFTINSTAPILESIQAPCITIGAEEQEVILRGSNFARNAVGRIGTSGAGVRATTFVSSSELRMALTAADLSSGGNKSIYVINPNPNGTTSDLQTLVVNHTIETASIVNSTRSPECTGTSRTYTAPADFTNYEWAVTEGVTITSATTTSNVLSVRFNDTAPASGKVTITVKATNPCGVSGTRSFDILINQTPPDVITYDTPLTFCEGGSVTLKAPEALAGEEAYRYQWQHNGVNIPDATAPIYTATEAGSYRVRVTAADPNICSNLATPVTVSITSSLSQGEIAGKTTYCQLTTVAAADRLTATVEGGIDDDGSTIRPRTYRWEQSSSANGPWEDAIGANTAATYSPSTATAGTMYYRRTVYAGGCQNTTAPVAVTVTPEILSNTVTGTQTVCSGSPIALLDGESATAGSETVEYLWEQSATGASGSWEPAEGVNNQEDYQPASRTVSTTSSLFYQRRVKAGECTSFSNRISVKVTAMPVATITQGINTYFCYPGSAVLTAQAVTGYTYKWYRVMEDGEDVEVGTDRSISVGRVGDESAIDQYYVVATQVTDGNSCSTTSVPITVQETVVDNNILNSGNQTVCYGETPDVILGTNARSTLGDVLYQWQSSLTEDGTYSNIPGATDINLSLGPQTTESWYRRRATVGSCSIYSDPIAVFVKDQIVNSLTSANQTICLNNPAQTITGNPVTGGDGPGTYTYTWYQRTGTGEWEPASGIRNQESYMPQVSGTAGTYAFRRDVVSGNCTPIASNIITVTVQPAIAGNVIGGTAIYCLNAAANTLGTVGGTLSGGSGSGYTYSWQERVGENGTWETIEGATSSTYRPLTTTAGDFYYKRIVNSGACTSAESNEFKVTVLPAITNTLIGPGSYSYCQNTTATEIVGNVGGGDGANYTYLWQRSANGTTSWSPAAGINDQPSYTPVITTAGTNYYRRTVTSGACATAIASNVISVTVIPAIANNTLGGASSVCFNSQPAPVTGSLPTNGNGDYTYLWEQSTDGGATWVAAVGTNNEQNYQPPILTVTTQYRRTVSAGTCLPSISTPRTVTVNPLPVKPVISNLRSTMYTGDDPVTMEVNPSSSNGFFTILRGSTQVPNATVSFSPCALGVGTYIVTYTYSNSNGCSVTSDPVVVNVRATTYAAVTVASPFPICRGQNTTYTAYVYRDVEVINANDSRHPSYAEYQAAPNWKQDEYYRYWQPDVRPKEGITASLASLEVKPEQIKLYDWYRNNISLGPNRQTTRQAGLSATDAYYVKITLNDDIAKCNTVVPILTSNALWISSPEAYNFRLTAPNPVCSNQAVTVTATSVANFDFANLNLELYFYLSRNGQVTQLNQTPYTVAPGTVAPYVFNYTFQPGELQNGDQVYISWSTDQIKCLSRGELSTVTMVVNDPPAITSQPTNQFFCAGTTVSMSVAATGSSLTYQWYKRPGNSTTGSGSAVSGGTNATLTFNNAAASIAGNYYVVVSGACTPAVESNNVELILNAATAIATQPLGNTVCVGAGHTFAVNATGTSLTYQWLRNGANIPGATSANYTITNAQPTDAASYSVRITGTCGTVTSAPVAFVVNVPPSITQQPASQEVCVGATNVTMSVTATGSGLTYQWSYNGTPIPGADQSTYNIPVVSTASAGNYSVSIQGACPPSLSSVATLTVNPLPTVTVNSETICAGEVATISAEAQNGSGNYTYVWTVPTGVTNPGNVASFNTSVAGTYEVRVTDSRACKGAEPAKGTVAVTPRKTALTGEISATNDLGDISPSNPIAVGDRVTFTASSEIIDNGPVSFAWSVYDAVTGNWIPQSGENGSTFVIDEVGEADLNVQCIIIPGIRNCYAPLAIEFGLITPLPVELLYFNATKRGNDVVLDWATASELDNKGFEVQVSSDAKNFRVLGFVESKVNTTSLKQLYTFVDKENGKQGVRYYRLKQVDLDGKSEIFNIKAVHFDVVSANKVKAYPNPFHSEVELSIDAELDGELQITVTTATGQQLLQRTVQVAKGTNIEKLTLDPNLPRGVYIISTRMGDFNSHFKLLKQ